MKKINNQTGCPKIDIFYKGLYVCSTDQSKTCKEAKAGYIKRNQKYEAKFITAHFDKI